MDGRSKNRNNPFSKIPMDASGCMKKDNREMSNCSKVILVPNNGAQSSIFQSLVFQKMPI